MAEEQRGSRGKSYGNHKSYGSGRPGNRGGKGFKPRGNGGKSYGHKSGGFHNDDRKGGYRKGNGGGYRRGDRDFHRDGEDQSLLHLLQLLMHQILYFCHFHRDFSYFVILLHMLTLYFFADFV